MCGIVGVVSRPATRPAADRAEVLALLDAAIVSVGDPAAATEAAAAADAMLRGVPGVLALANDRELVASIVARLDVLDAAVDELDVSLESAHHDPNELERSSAQAIALRDVLWAIAPRSFAHGPRGRRHSPVATPVSAPCRPTSAIQQALSAIDRLEVRGRDSAGIHVFVHEHGLDLDRPGGDDGDRDRELDPHVPVRLGARRRARCSRSCTRRPPRSANSATTPRRCARRSSPTICCVGRVASPDARVVGARATPAGRASASSPNPTRTRSTATSSSSHRRCNRPVHGRRAQR